MNAAALIAEHLPHGVPHPGNADMPPTIIQIPALRNTGIPPEMADHFAAEAGIPTRDTSTLLAEAIVHLLETNGIHLVADSDLEALKLAAADAPDGARVISIRCQSHTTELLQLTIGKTDQTAIDCSSLARAVKHHQDNHQ